MISQERVRIGDYKPPEKGNAGEASAVEVGLNPLNRSVDDRPPHVVRGRPHLAWPLKVAFLAPAFLAGCAKPVFIGGVGAKIGSSGLVLLKKVCLKQPQDRWPGQYPLHDIASFPFSKGDEASLERALFDLRWFVIKEGRYVNEPHPQTGQVPLDLGIAHHNKEIVKELLRASAQGDFDLMIQNWAHEGIYEMLYFMISNDMELGHLQGAQFRNPMQWLVGIGNHRYIAFALDGNPRNGELLPQGYERRSFPEPPICVNGAWSGPSY